MESHISVYGNIAHPLQLVDGVIAGVVVILNAHHLRMKNVGTQIITSVLRIVMVASTQYLRQD